MDLWERLSSQVVYFYIKHTYTHMHTLTCVTYNFDKYKIVWFSMTVSNITIIIYNGCLPFLNNAPSPIKGLPAIFLLTLLCILLLPSLEPTIHNYFWLFKLIWLIFRLHSYCRLGARKKNEKEHASFFLSGCAWHHSIKYFLVLSIYLWVSWFHYSS